LTAIVIPYKFLMRSPIYKMPSTKYIIVTGGVLSGLGKGIAAASTGHLLSSRLKIIPIKCDGYLNVDPGTMNPFLGTTSDSWVFGADPSGTSPWVRYLTW